MDTYSKTIIQKFDNGVNIVHIPDLTDEERARRQAQRRRAAEQLLKEAERVKKTTGRAKRAFCVVHNSTIVVPLIPPFTQKRCATPLCAPHRGHVGQAGGREH